MKTTIPRSHEDFCYDAYTISILTEIMSSMCILNNRYNLGFTYVLDDHDLNFYAAIRLPEYEMPSIDIRYLNDPKALRKLEMFSNYLKKYINDHPFA